MHTNIHLHIPITNKHTHKHTYKHTYKHTHTNTHKLNHRTYYYLTIYNLPFSDPIEYENFYNSNVRIEDEVKKNILPKGL